MIVTAVLCYDRPRIALPIPARTVLPVPARTVLPVPAPYRFAIPARTVLPVPAPYRFAHTGPYRFARTGPYRFACTGPYRFTHTGPYRFACTGPYRFAHTGPVPFCLHKPLAKFQALVYDILPLEDGAGKRCSECGPYQPVPPQYRPSTAPSRCGRGTGPPDFPVCSPHCKYTVPPTSVLKWANSYFA